MSSYKSNLMSSMSIAAPRLRQVHPHNPISLNAEDAAKLGISNGDRIEVRTPGAKLEGVALVRSGVAKGRLPSSLAMVIPSWVPWHTPSMASLPMPTHSTAMVSI